MRPLGVGREVRLFFLPEHVFSFKNVFRLNKFNCFSPQKIAQQCFVGVVRARLTIKDEVKIDESKRSETKAPYASGT